MRAAPACLLIALAAAAAHGEKWDRAKACEGCKWLHAKLRLDYDAIDPQVRRYGGGFTRLSRAEKAGQAVDTWCDGVAQIIYTRAPPVGQAGVPEFAAKDIRMLELQCKKLQEKYRLKAVSLLAAATNPADIPLAVLCEDECLRPHRKPGKKPKPKPPEPIPSDDEIRKYSVKQLKKFLKVPDPKVFGETKGAIVQAALDKAVKMRAREAEAAEKTAAQEEASGAADREL
eukprot:TRINITY_DN17044_c0_g1_i1.p1 TRINITY_DN17044_c0_g1~~TRINITY_DN17044_c0_g1_i1.p1  ORF type:complete len:230 (+),score=78.18 TRINITY_DN17044_c0_g1_i1:129-818(+)